MEALAGDLNVCSRRGLAERFDSTIGAGTVLMPFGGETQLTPVPGHGAENLPGERATPTLCSLHGLGL